MHIHSKNKLTKLELVENIKKVDSVKKSNTIGCHIKKEVYHNKLDKRTNKESGIFLKYAFNEYPKL